MIPYCPSGFATADRLLKTGSSGLRRRPEVGGARRHQRGAGGLPVPGRDRTRRHQAAAALQRVRAERSDSETMSASNVGLPLRSSSGHRRAVARRRLGGAAGRAGSSDRSLCRSLSPRGGIGRHRGRHCGRSPAGIRLRWGWSSSWSWPRWAATGTRWFRADAGRADARRPFPCRAGWSRSSRVAALAAFVLRASIAETFAVHGPSMLPTLLPNDTVLVNRMAYGFKIPFSSVRLWQKPPARGDLVVFRATEMAGADGPQMVVKRVIGIPGDTVALRGGDVFINGWMVPSCDAGPFVSLLAKHNVGGPPDRRIAGRSDLPGGPQTAGRRVPRVRGQARRDLRPGRQPRDQQRLAHLDGRDRTRSPNLRARRQGDPHRRRRGRRRPHGPVPPVQEAGRPDRAHAAAST